MEETVSNQIIRLSEIEINNFKNITHGHITIGNSKKNYQVSILGLYGQNGSGKTALIDAIELLKYALCGKSIPTEYANYISVGSNCSTIRYEFTIRPTNQDTLHRVSYQLCLGTENTQSENNIGLTETHSRPNAKAVILNEVLKASFDSEGKQIRMSKIIDTGADDSIFLPTAKYEMLIGNNKELWANLMAAKKLAREKSASFIFSRTLLDAVQGNPASNRYQELMVSMAYYGNFELFVLKTANNGLITLNALPISFNFYKNGIPTIGSILLPLNKSIAVSQDRLTMINSIISKMNIVLKEIIPGLTIGIKEFESQLDKDGTPIKVIQLVSQRNDKEFPFRYESEGIKKLVSVLHLLIAVYNNPSITVAIDELDSGIFEYLLGELLCVLAEGGKGQLIFTSHNLRPLETIGQEFIAFTTTNPENRYVRLNKIKTSNNLRNVYYRDIVLGGQEDPLYDATNNSEIAFAFREAGYQNEK